MMGTLDCTCGIPGAGPCPVRVFGETERLQARIAELEQKLTAAREIVKRYIVAQGSHLYESWREVLIKDCGLVVDEVGFVVLPKSDEGGAVTRHESESGNADLSTSHPEPHTCPHPDWIRISSQSSTNKTLITCRSCGTARMVLTDQMRESP